MAGRTLQATGRIVRTAMVTGKGKNYPLVIKKNNQQLFLFRLELHKLAEIKCQNNSEKSLIDALNIEIVNEQ